MLICKRKHSSGRKCILQTRRYTCVQWAMFAAIAFALPLLPFAHPQAKISATVIEHVRVIDGTGRPPIENVTILLEGGKIAFVGSQKPVSAPKNAKTIDATGQTLIPGLINAHG